MFRFCVVGILVCSATHLLTNVCATVSRTNCYTSREVFKFRLHAFRLPGTHTMGVDVTVFWNVISVRLAIRIREVITKKIILRCRLITFRTQQKAPIDEPLDYPSIFSSTRLTILFTRILLVTTQCYAFNDYVFMFWS